ncbi:hypothetical protein [Actinacidiphila sp. bgisy144]
MNPAVPAPTALPAKEPDATTGSVRQWAITTTTGERTTRSGAAGKASIQ